MEPNNIKLQAGMQIEFKSGNQYKIIKVFSHNLVDLQAVKPEFKLMPDYLPIYYSVQLKDYKILNPLKGEVCPECKSKKLFKCLTKRKCLDCNNVFESDLEYKECTEE